MGGINGTGLATDIIPGFDNASAYATGAVESGSNMVAQLVQQMNDLMADLANPKQQASAQAHLQLLQMQVSMITNVLNAIKDLMKSFFQR